MLQIPRVHFITHEISGHTHLTALQLFCEAGAELVQLRVKDADHDQWLQLAQQAAEICRKHNTLLIINDNPAIAVAVGAAGVHLGKNDMPIAEARKICGEKMIIGGTANTFADIVRHHAQGANYVGVGPFRFTTTKKVLSPVLGADGYRNILQMSKEANISIPIIAIGGITETDIASLMSTGIHGLAIAGAALTAKTPTKTIQNICKLARQ